MDEIGHGDAIDELQFLDVFGLLGIVAVQAPFVLQINEGLRADIFGEQKRAAVGAMRRDGSELRRMLEETVGRDARGDGQVAFAAEHGQLLQVVAMTDAYAAMLGQEHGQHFSILGRNLVPKFRQYARGHSKIHADIVNVACSRAATGHKQNLELLLGLQQHVNNGKKCLGTAIHDGLSANFEHIHVWVHAEIVRGFGFGQKLLADQRLSHEWGVDMKSSNL